MVKQGLDQTTCRACVRTTITGGGWALCIGAGASRPIFPFWSVLVERLLRWTNLKFPAVQIARLLKECTLESLVQATVTRNNLNAYQARQVLSKLLYDDLKGKIGGTDWLLVKKLFKDSSLGRMRDQDATDMLGLMLSNYPQATSLQLAESLTRAIEADIAPTSIISFNAEPLLLALTNSYLRVNSTVPKHKLIDVSLRGISYKHRQRIPFHFCHGLLSLPGEKARKDASSLDKLVFSETEYLNLAGSSFSWQSAIFLEAAMHNTIVFVGLSFSDPNLRRWLGFVQSNRVAELNRIGRKIEASTRHYWKRRPPTSLNERRWIEASVAHLGVRLVWLRDWTETGSALR